jgi:hypothetical protein
MRFSLGTIGLADGLRSAFTGLFGANLGADDPAAEDNLAGLGAHGPGITAGLASRRNATRIRRSERFGHTTGSVNVHSLLDDHKSEGDP